MKYIKIIVLLTFIIILVTIFFFGIRGITTLFQNTFYVNTNGATVVKELRSLNRWETASFTVEKIIDAGTNGNAFQEFLFGDKILLIADGEVIAGFDLSTITDNSVAIAGKKISVALPKPQILVTRLDNNKTRVYDRREGILAHPNKDLESQARLSAENAIRDGACQEGVLNIASDNAKKQLMTLLKTLGFTTVVITIPQGTC